MKITFGLFLAIAMVFGATALSMEDCESYDDDEEQYEEFIDECSDEVEEKYKADGKFETAQTDPTLAMEVADEVEMCALKKLKCIDDSGKFNVDTIKTYVDGTNFTTAMKTWMKANVDKCAANEKIVGAKDVLEQMGYLEYCIESLFNMDPTCKDVSN